MARVMDVVSENDLANGRVWSMWGEAGLQFRSNVILEVGGSIPFHKHNYDHVALITQGIFDVDETAPDGSTRHYCVAAKAHGVDSAGYRVTIRAWHEHRFTLREHLPGEVLCFWPG